MRALTDQSGAVVATYAYDAYGQPTRSTGSASNPFRYAGQYRDSESGLYYLRARYYDPATAQFLTVDPLLAATEQAYAYAAGSPLNATDPSGLKNAISEAGGGAGGDFVLPLAVALWSLAEAAAYNAVMPCVAPHFPDVFPAAQDPPDSPKVGWQDLPWRRKGMPAAEPGKLYYDPPGPRTTKQDAWTNERGGGYRDARGRIWHPDPSGHRGRHWDVEQPDGSHINVQPDGRITPSIANPYPLPPHP